MSLDFDVTRDVLIPRPDTEFCSNRQLFLQEQSRSTRARFDLCCGSGCIGHFPSRIMRKTQRSF
jgi:methylase of polypeptide subunit release factors